MKRLILFELIILFLATTFESDSPPGWFQQVLPVNDQINDIFFLDSLTGWVVTDGRTSTNDTGYILKTIDGGNNWSVQYNQPMKLTTVQFLDNNTGYVGGGSGSGTAKVFGTSNGGINWLLISGSLLSFGDLDDMFFLNKDTGWACDKESFGGLAKTIDGGFNWQIQLNDSFSPSKLFFLNLDTGWAACNDNKLYRTINGGVNWGLQFTFSGGMGDIYFFNQLTGIVSSSRFMRTTDGGFNWTMSTSTETGMKLSFVNDSIGWAGYNLIYAVKTINGGLTWFFQTTNISNPSVSSSDSLNAWAGGSGLVHTTDGGGPPVGIQQIGTEVPSEYKLYQNYPNPFNPKTIIRFQIIRLSDVKLMVYDIQGKQIAELVNQKQTAGAYEVDFNGSNYSSGVYFYSLIIDGKIIDTKKMLMLK